MRLDTSQQMRMQQKLILAPRMIQSMEILQLPVMELQERIQQELQENPVLEMRDDRPEDAPAEEATATEEPSDREQELVVDTDNDNQLDFDRLDALGKDWEDHFNEDHRPSRGSLDEAGDKKHDAMQNMPSRPQSLQEYLLEQVGFLELEPAQAELVRFLISNLDENGRLTGPLEVVISGFDRPVGLAEAEEALRCIQKLEPAGVGARDIRECLLLQLTDETPLVDVVRKLIENHWEDIGHNRLPIIQRHTGFDLPTIQEALDVLRHLNPRPGSSFANNHTPYVVPDILVERNENDQYTVRLLDDYIPKIYISRRLVEMLNNRHTDPKTREYLKRKIQSAQWLMESIEQRRGTLEKVTRAIIDHQKGFLDKGPEYITPLKMQQIADEVHVHVTTVSRAVDDKWVQTPRGVFPLKRFFGGGTTTAEGEEVAWEIIKRKLLEIVDQENKANPYSDEELVDKMQEAGYPVARRTVTKYRKLLKIPSSRQRKDWTLSNGHPAALEPEPPEVAEPVVAESAVVMEPMAVAQPSPTVHEAAPPAIEQPIAVFGPMEMP